MRSLLLVVAALSSSGCVHPRPVSYGMDASLLRPDEAELGVSIGALTWGEHTRSTADSGPATTTTSAGAAGPIYEALWQMGLLGPATWTLRASAWGVAPGAKFTVTRGPVSFAIAPELGLSYQASKYRADLSFGGIASPIIQEDQEVRGTFQATPALRLLVSGGRFYGGMGYALVTEESRFDDGSNSARSELLHHQLTGAVGWTFGEGPALLRAELAGYWSPWGSSWSSAGLSLSHRQWALHPSIAVVIRPGASR